MRDGAGKIIYIGKARNLKKRVSSYFQKRDLGAKIHALIGLVRCVNFIECAGEREALLLEQKWIKSYQPIFNAIWKDDKSYPYVILSMQEDFPRLYLARRKHIPPGAAAYGPYPSAGKVRGLMRWLFRTGALRLRPCRWDFSLKEPLSPKIINSCLYYHTKQCPAPCAGLISRAAYREIARQAALLFSGQEHRYKRYLQKMMKQAAKNLQFEKAAQIKQHLESIEHIAERVLITAIQREDLEGLYDPNNAVISLKQHLDLTNPPLHIEAFDISNISGAHAVGSMVCFKEGKPHKNHYRRLRIKTISGINDFAMMQEVVARRLQGLIKNNESLPDLFLIDGGKGQLNAARRALGQAAPQKISQPPALCSLAKREEILYLDQWPQPPKEIKLAKTDEGLKLCMWIRDEAHRFAITYHRNLRRKNLLAQ